MACELIKLKNIKEIYNFRVITLHGEIENLCEEEFVEIIINDDCIKITQIFNKHFKCLVELKDGDNEIKLRYFDAEKVLKLKYEAVKTVNYDIQPIYVIPRGHDGTFQSMTSNGNSTKEALTKINLALQLVASVLGSKFIDAGSEIGKSFVLNDCQVFDSTLSVDHVRSINQFELYDALADELVKTYGKDVAKKRKFVAFISCTQFLGLTENDDYNYVNIKSKTLANPALGTGFLALLGSGSFYSWPSKIDEVQDAFLNKSIVDTRFLLDDSNYRKTYGGNFATSLGSLIHEIGHIFDLGHTQTGFMGNDFDYVNRFFITENYTEIMPKRTVSNCQQAPTSSSVNVHSTKLTKISRNGGDYLEKYRQQKNNDMTFFEPNCMLTMMSHRWFTQEKDMSEAFITFDEVEKVITASDEIVLVEIRELDSLLRQFWDLKLNFTKIFQLPPDANLKNCIIFAITKTGSTLKTKSCATS